VTSKINIAYASVDKLYLDPSNPRLGRQSIGAGLTQKQLLDAMSNWTLNELAESFIANGFWPHEALVVVRETTGKGKARLMVIEGNRRLAALKCIKAAVDGQLQEDYWADLVRDNQIPPELLDHVPYIEVKSRHEVSAYLGFRHVTGIKEWKPAEKAQYIAKLIEGDGLAYDEVSRRIGSKTPTVRTHYISYRLLLQMADQDTIDIEKVEQRFSLLYLSLRSPGVQQYLELDLSALPNKAAKPVPTRNLKRLSYFARWLFGDQTSAPLITDSRNIDQFARVLGSPEAVEYLERTPNAQYDLALRKAGVGEDEVVQLVLNAADNIRFALTEAHVHKKSPKMQRAIRRLGIDFAALLNNFPTLQVEIAKEIRDVGNT
jgi:hypothetical protein